MHAQPLRPPAAKHTAVSWQRDSAITNEKGEILPVFSDTSLRCAAKLEANAHQYF
jgi:hypothetical protein